MDLFATSNDLPGRTLGGLVIQAVEVAVLGFLDAYNII